MKAVYENHYLSDRDVANFARQSFAKLAENFTEAQNNQLIKFLARGMASGDWDSLIKGLLQLGVNYTHARDSLQEEVTIEAQAKELAIYLRNIPEHWVPFGHPQISLRMQAPIPIRVQCFKHKIGFVESEESRRYISTRPEVFHPRPRSLMLGHEANAKGFRLSFRGGENCSRAVPRRLCASG